MKRDIKLIKRLGKTVDDCCPGHSVFPSDTYKNRRSKRARSRDKKIEHRYTRRILNRINFQEE
jgi:hypothetical protein